MLSMELLTHAQYGSGRRYRPRRLLTGPAATGSSFKSSVLSLKEKLKAFQERLVEERKKRLEERKKQRKEDRRNAFYRQKEEEAQRIHEEQLKKGNLCWHMCSGKGKVGHDEGGAGLVL